MISFDEFGAHADPIKSMLSKYPPKQYSTTLEFMLDWQDICPIFVLGWYPFVFYRYTNEYFEFSCSSFLLNFYNTSRYYNPQNWENRFLMFQSNKILHQYQSMFNKVSFRCCKNSTRVTYVRAKYLHNDLYQYIFSFLIPC